MADSESVRGSLRGRLPRLRDKGKHKAKIMASREALGLGESAGDVRPNTMRPNTTRPNTAASQLAEDWNEANLLDPGKGGFLSSFKEKVQVMAQRQAQIQIEKELREVNEFRTKVAASVDEKLLDYTLQMQAANRNIATVTAKLHHLSSNIGEQKIKQLLAGIVQPYFEALSGDTSRRLNEMEERSNRLEMERTKRFESELESGRQTNRAAKAKMEEILTMTTNATAATERQLSEVNSTFHDIKKFAETLPNLAKETQASAESAARQLIQQADDFNRAETVKLNEFRADEIRKLERSLQSVGENVMENVNHAVTRGKVHAEYIQEKIDIADRNLDCSFKNFAVEVKHLTEDVTETMKRTNEAERKARNAIAEIESSMKPVASTSKPQNGYFKKIWDVSPQSDDRIRRDSGVFLDDYLQKFEAQITKSHRILNDCAERIEHNAAEAGLSVANSFLKFSKETEDSLNGYVNKVRDVNTESEKEFKRAQRDRGVFFDNYLQKFEQSTTQAEETLGNYAQKIEQNTSKADEALDEFIQRINQSTSGTEKSVERFAEQIEHSTTKAGETLAEYAHVIEQNNTRTGETLYAFAHKIEEDTTKAEESVTRVFGSATKEMGLCLDSYVDKFHDVRSQAEGSISSVFDRLAKETDKSLEANVLRIREVSTEAQGMISSTFERFGQQNEMSFEGQLAKIQEANSQGEESLVNAFEKMGERFGETFDAHTTEFHARSEVSLASTFKRLTKETDDSLDGHIEAIQNQTNKAVSSIKEGLGKLEEDFVHSLDGCAEKIQDASAQASEKALTFEPVIEKFKADIESHLHAHAELLEVHGQMIESVALTSREDMVERYISTLQTCSEERQSHAKDLKSVDGRLKDLDSMLSLIATEIGCSVDPFIGSGINLPDSPITPGFPKRQNTIKSQFDEASCGITELLDFCKDFRSQVNDISNDISTALGVLPPGETISTMLESSVNTTESLSKVVGVPTTDSSLWGIMEGIEESSKCNGEAYERLDTVFKETRNFVSNANGALGYVPITLQELSRSATEVTKSVLTSTTVTEESNTLTESLNSNLRTTVQALTRCKGDLETMDKAVKSSKDLVEEGKKSAESGNLIVSEMQDVLLETSRSVGEIVNTTSGMSRSAETCKATVKGFKTEIELFKDSVWTTKASIDGSLALANFFQDDVQSVGDEFKTATETMKHVTESIGTLQRSVSGVGQDMDRATDTIMDTRRTVENLNGSIGDAEYSIKSLTKSLATFGDTVETAASSLKHVSATAIGAQENINKLNKGIRVPEDLVEEMEASLVTLTEVANATETSIFEASTLLHDRTKEVDNARELDNAKLPTPDVFESDEENEPSLNESSIEEDLPSPPPPPEEPIRPQSPESSASTRDNKIVDDRAEVAASDIIEEDSGHAVLLEPEQTQEPAVTADTPSLDSSDQHRPCTTPNKRRGLSDFFYIPQWMSAPALKDSPIPANSGTSTTTGLTRKESIVDMLRRDKSSSVVRSGISDDTGDDVDDVPVEADEQRLHSDEGAEVSIGHTPCGDCTDGVSVNASGVTDVNSDNGVDTAGRTNVPDAAATQTPTGHVAAPELSIVLEPTAPTPAVLRTAGERRMRRIDHEPAYARGQIYEGLTWQRHEMLPHRAMYDDALMIWMQTGL